MASFDALLSDNAQEKIADAASKSGAPIRGMLSEEFTSLFDHVTRQIASVSTGTKMAVVGDEEIGKTHFCTTMPPPITAIVTDLRFMLILQTQFRRTLAKPSLYTDQKFVKWLADKEIYIYNALVLNKETRRPDYVESVKQFETALKVVAKHVDKGTFLVDNSSDMRLWLNALVDEEAQFHNPVTGQPYRFQWGSANKIVRGMTETFRAKRMHFCLTAHTKPVWDKKGKEIANQTDVDWNRTTSGDLDLIMEGRKLYTSEAIAKSRGAQLVSAKSNKIGPYIRPWFVRKSTRWPEYAQLCGTNGYLYDMTFPSLQQDIINKVGFDIGDIR